VCAHIRCVHTSKVYIFVYIYVYTSEVYIFVYVYLNRFVYIYLNIFVYMHIWWISIWCVRTHLCAHIRCVQTWDRYAATAQRRYGTKTPCVLCLKDRGVSVSCVCVKIKLPCFDAPPCFDADTRQRHPVSCVCVQKTPCVMCQKDICFLCLRPHIRWCVYILQQVFASCVISCDM